MNIFTRQEWIHRHRNNFMVPKGKLNQVWGFKYTHCYIKWALVINDKGSANAGDEDLGLIGRSLKNEVAANSYIYYYEGNAMDRREACKELQRLQGSKRVTHSNQTKTTIYTKQITNKDLLCFVVLCSISVYNVKILQKNIIYI